MATDESEYQRLCDMLNSVAKAIPLEYQVAENRVADTVRNAIRVGQHEIGDNPARVTEIETLSEQLGRDVARLSWIKRIVDETSKQRVVWELDDYAPRRFTPRMFEVVKWSVGFYPETRKPYGNWGKLLGTSKMEILVSPGALLRCMLIDDGKTKRRDDGYKLFGIATPEGKVKIISDEEARERWDKSHRPDP